MTFLEAMQGLTQQPGKWARAVRWRGLGYALCPSRDGHNPEAVPGPRGGWPPTIPSFEILADEWELVDPKEVVAGR